MTYFIYNIACLPPGHKLSTILELYKRTGKIYYYPSPNGDTITPTPMKEMDEEDDDIRPGTLVDISNDEGAEDFRLALERLINED